MVPFALGRRGRPLMALALALGVLVASSGIVTVSAEVATSQVAAGSATVSNVARLPPLGSLELNEKLRAECGVVRALGEQKRQLLLQGGDEDGEETSSTKSRLFSLLFPGSPAVNALLATLYISGPPNFLLALCPTDIDPSSLSVMVAFAVGGLLGDTLFHLLPEIFVGEDDERADRARLVLVEPNRNLLLGVAIMVGFMTFVAMDKGLRIATGGGGGHEHGHSHSHNVPASAVTSSADTTSASVTSRKKSSGKKDDKAAVVAVESTHEASASIKLSGYLNMVADFTHNITDGLAMSASFYASPTIGATTTVAVFFHEIPHEVGDFALLVQSGFSKRAALGAQFITALGALLGTVIGILVQELGGSTSGSTMTNSAAAPWSASAGRGGLMGTSLTWGDLLLPFTAGTFLYVGTVAVIPELLETDLEKKGSSKLGELRKTLVQFGAIAAGAGIMLYISWQ
ncbi:zip family metal cation transporter [Grosmannia clavigera kw1407]|uniref:Zip family metal cation transporter n=1 Tax=Grosmannia clavigera (strain kw1407 / UAMH 11150) TaxID=655863 RepID=F0XI41_GROCL|nr:zip family metal cation transporter [Grosmannia clavigera kw1407]EFX02945.1 zip family metal cation transporter [Grosmannia clavigera kw1407]